MANYLNKKDCASCGGKSSVAVYDDGSSYCFHIDCKETTRGTEEAATKLGDTYNESYVPLAKRKISMKTCELFKYSVGTKSGKPVQIVTYTDKKGKVCAKKFRYPDKVFGWEGNAKQATLFGKHLWRPHANIDIVVTEGEIDAMSIAEAQDCKYPVVSVPNGAAAARRALKMDHEWLSQFRHVILAFDNDEAGKIATEECAGLFKPGTVKIVTLPMKDANEMLQAGRGQEIIQSILRSKEYRPDGIISGADISLEDLRKKEKAGFATPYPTLNNMCRGMHKGRLMLVAAAPGTGKSTLLKEFGYHMRTKHKLKVGNIFLEETLRYSALSYMALDNNVPAFSLVENPGILEKQDFDKSYNELINNKDMFFYDHFGSLDTENLLRKIEYLAVGEGVDFILLDHISMVISGNKSSREGERKDIDMLMTQLRSLIQRTGIGVAAVVHVKRREAPTDFTEGGKLRLSDLRGSGSLEQLSDFVVGLERDQQGEDTTTMKLRVLKNRLTGNTGVADTIQYDTDTGRLRLAEEPFE